MEAEGREIREGNRPERAGAPEGCPPSPPQGDRRGDARGAGARLADATRLRILVADEEFDSIGFVTAALDGTGHAITAARSHPHALALLGSERFDVLMFDIWAETLPGLRLFEKARELHEYIEGIVITGAVSIYSVLDCYRAGIIDYLAKPLGDPEVVRRAIERAVERRRHWLEILKSLEYQKIGG